MKIDLISHWNNIITVSSETCQIFIQKYVAEKGKSLKLSISRFTRSCRLLLKISEKQEFHKALSSWHQPSNSCAWYFLCRDIKSPFKLILLRFTYFIFYLFPQNSMNFHVLQANFRRIIIFFFKWFFKFPKNSARVFERFQHTLLLVEGKGSIDFPLYFVFFLHNRKLFA